MYKCIAFNFNFFYIKKQIIEKKAKNFCLAV